MNNIETDIFPLAYDIISTYQASYASIQAKVVSELYQTKQIHDNTLIIFRNKIFLPDALFHLVLQWYHDNLNHPGAKRTYKTI